MSFPSVLTLQPSVENCDPVAVHQRSTPGDFSMQENPVLYGGGRKWIMECSDAECLFGLVRKNILQVDLFVLNFVFVVWFNDYDYGMQVPYPCISQHSVMKSKEGKLQLYLKIRLPEDLTVEFVFMPMYGEDERCTNDTIERLFTHEFFGVNKDDKMVYNTFAAIAKCSMFHCSDDIESFDDDIESLDQGSNLIDDNTYDNSGNADDMDMNYQLDTIGDACLGVDIYEGYSRGTTRNREELGSSQENSRYSTKRIRC
jgi:hypothetical protein